jgi:hypothetical protein
MWGRRSVGGWWQAIGTGGAVSFSAWRSAHVERQVVGGLVDHAPFGRWAVI